MALNANTSKATIASATGFNLSNEHCLTGETITAIVDGTLNHLKANAKIVVNSHAGSTYPITGINESGLASEIMALMTSFNFDNPHSKADVLPKAVAKAVASVLMSKGKVTVPTDGVGQYPIKYVTANDLSNTIESHLVASGFNTDNAHSRTNPMRDAIANELARAISSDAWYAVNGVSGGVFFML